MLTRLEYAVVRVEDLDEALRDHTALLGIEPGPRLRWFAAGAETASFALAKTSLLLVAPAPGAAGRPDPSHDLIAAVLQRAPGVAGLVFATDALASTRAALLTRGVAVGEPFALQASSASEGGRDGTAKPWRAALLSPASSRGVPIAIREAGEPGESPSGAAEPLAHAIEALDHVVVGSPAIEESGRLYGSALGLRLALDRSFPARGLRMHFYRIAGVTIEVVGELAAAAAPSQPDRFGGLAWRTPDPVACHGRLLGAGFELSEPRAGHKPGTRVFTVKSRTHGVPTLVIGPDV